METVECDTLVAMHARRPAPEDLPPLNDAARGVRLNKALADAGIGSRRACDALIEQGQVAVNGQTVAQMPVWVEPSVDRITVAGKMIARKKRELGSLYLMVFKPRNVICTNRDPEGRRRVIDLVPHTQRLFCVGRLDAESTGLVLLTNDGELTQKLTHPSHEVPKTYQATIKGRLQPEDIEKLRRGIFLGEKKTGRAQRARTSGIRLITRDVDRSKIEITLREGRNREIRRMMARLGHPVKKLRRIAIGPVKLKGLAMGDWRTLTRYEVGALKRAVR